MRISRRGDDAGDEDRAIRHGLDAAEVEDLPEVVLILRLEEPRVRGIACAIHPDDGGRAASTDEDEPSIWSWRQSLSGDEVGRLCPQHFASRSQAHDRRSDQSSVSRSKHILGRADHLGQSHGGCAKACHA